MATQSNLKLQYPLCPLLLHTDLCVCFAAVRESEATLLLTAPTQTELDNGTATFICLAQNFAPKSHTFKWTHGSKDINSKAKPTIISQQKDLYTAISMLVIDAMEFTGSSSPIKCELTQSKYSPKTKETTYGMHYIILLDFFCLSI